MASSVSALLLGTLLLIACAFSASYAQKGCDGFAPTAKLRFQWFYQLTDPKAVKTVDELVLKWMKEDCPGAIAYGQGGAITTDPAAFGLTVVPATAQFADYAAWSDWASIDDLKKCYENGLKSGNVAAIRKYNKKAARLVIPLTPGTGSTTLTCPADSLAPATVRFMFTYMLTNPSPAVCKQGTELNAAIAKAWGQFVRHNAACDVVTDDSKVYAPTITNTADYGGFLDFKSLADMTKYLSDKSPEIVRDRNALRALASSSMRVAIALPAKSYTNIKPAGRRMAA